MVFGGQAGGWPQIFAENMLGNMLGMEFAPIESSRRRSRLMASGRPQHGRGKHRAAHRADDNQGERLAVVNPTGSEVGPVRARYVRIASTDKADAFGFNWDRSGKSSKHIPFEWSSETVLSADYAFSRLLLHRVVVRAARLFVLHRAVIFQPPFVHPHPLHRPRRLGGVGER